MPLYAMYFSVLFTMNISWSHQRSRIFLTFPYINKKTSWPSPLFPSCGVSKNAPHPGTTTGFTVPSIHPDDEITHDLFWPGGTPVTTSSVFIRSLKAVWSALTALTTCSTWSVKQIQWPERKPMGKKEKGSEKVVGRSLLLLLLLLLLFKIIPVWISISIHNHVYDHMLYVQSYTHIHSYDHNMPCKIIDT